MVSDQSQFLGRGWAFPPTFPNHGRGVGMVSEEEDILQSLRILLGTNIGERVLRPMFGWRRDALAFEPLTASSGALLRREIEQAVLFFEPRIDLNRITVNQSQDDVGRIDLRLDYTIRATNSRTNLVYPFYRDEANDA